MGRCFSPMYGKALLQHSSATISCSWTTSHHKVAGVEEAIEAAGATLIYLPKYSPDLNPIELAFSKLKALLRKAAERTIPHLWRRIGRIINSFSAKECMNFFRHAGYVRT